jgi:Tfp pilus assembly protein PilN
MRRRTKQLRPPTGLYIDERNATAVVIEYGATGKFNKHVIPVDERRQVNITSSDLRTVAANANAHSQYSAPLTADHADEEILNALIEKIDPGAGLIANYTRTPNNQILLTQAEEGPVSVLTNRVRLWLESQRAEHAPNVDYILRVETRTRAIARLWASSADTLPGETIAFLVLSENDCAFALWSAETELAYETEDNFELGAGAAIKCQHARDTLSKLIGTGTLDSLNLPPVTTVVISAPDDYEDQLLAVLTTAADLSHLRIGPVSMRDTESGEMLILDQPSAFAIGALLDDPTIPPCDLNISLQEQLYSLQHRTQEQEQIHTESKLMRAALTFLAPIVAVIAILTASYADRGIERARLQGRINAEEATSQKLAKENADYESSKANFAVFQTLLDNLIGLRKRQPAAEQLLRDLNQRWPRESSWFISEINVKGANVEIKGKTKNEQAITAFAKSLEFSDGLFTNILARNNLEGATSPTALLQPQAVASNIIEFRILATYAPLASPGKEHTSVNSTQTPTQPLPTAIPLATPSTAVPPMTMQNPALPPQAASTAPATANQPTPGAKQ